MNASFHNRRSLRVTAAAVALGASTAVVAAQAPPGQGRGNPPPTAQAGAPIDVTGYWVSIVSKEWRWRMVTPAKGDYASVPLNEAAKKVADGWDPARDEAAGMQCKSYGAPALMRVPGRLHITWQDDNTLKVETDTGTQVRLLRFAKASAQSPRTTSTQGPRTWQGQSAAEWLLSGGRGRGPVSGSLKVVTTNLRAGYLRKNGVPYGESTTLTEYWDLFKEPNGERWITITTVVEDPMYLVRPWETSVEFRKEPDGSKWDPTPCSAAW